jgi:DnaK suppressor protein
MDPALIAHFKATLEAQRAALIDLHQTSADTRKVVELDQTTVGRLSRVDAMQGQAMAQAAARNRSARVAAIVVALRRVEGTSSVTEKVVVS